MELIRSHVGLPVVCISRLGDDQSRAVWTDSQATRTSTAVSAGSEGVADEAPGRAGELEDAISVGVSDEHIAGLTVN